MIINCFSFIFTLAGWVTVTMKEVCETEDLSWSGITYKSRSNLPFVTKQQVQMDAHMKGRHKGCDNSCSIVNAILVSCCNSH